MILKKVNAIIAFLLIAACLVHVGVKCASILFSGESAGPDGMKFISGIVMTLAMMHVLIAIIIFFSHDSKMKIAYPRANVRIILQRVSGVLMLVFLFLHMKTTKRLTAHTDSGTGYYLLNNMIMAVFFAMVFLHISVSFSSALVTLGAVESMEKKRMIDRIVWVISGLFFLASAVIVFYGYRNMIGGMGL